MTFGPNYSVKESKEHYRSIYRARPSLMMHSILNCIEENIEQQKNYCIAIATKSIASTSIASSSHPNHHGHHSPLGIGSVTSSNEMTLPVFLSYENLCILMAEDNIINQKVLSQMLRRLGIKNNDIVDNGLKAVEESEKKEYDVLLLDMQMPVMGGLEATWIIVER
jgi:PleD family two-component response regulator